MAGHRQGVTFFGGGLRQRNAGPAALHHCNIATGNHRKVRHVLQWRYPMGNEVGLDLRHHLPALFGRLGIPIYCEQLQEGYANK